MRSMSPSIKLGIAGVTGADMSRGGLQVTRPFGTGNVDDQGRAAGTPLFMRPLEMAYQAARVLPISRVAMDVAPQVKIGNVTLGPVSRYGSGDLMRKYGTKNTPYKKDSRLMRALPLLGLPINKAPTGK
jgi:hypothetical protein